MDTRQWEETFAQVGAYWRHDGSMRRPHAILASGKHSDGYCNCSEIISRPELLQRVCDALIEPVHLRTAADWVVGSAFGSILVAYQLAKRLQSRAGFTERPAVERPLAFKRFHAAAGETALVVTTVLNNNRDVEQTLTALRAQGMDVRSEVAAIVNLSGCATIGEHSVVALDANEVSPWLPSAASVTNPYDHLISYPSSLESACRRLAGRLKYPRPTWVVGAGTAGIPTAYELASQLGCRAGFTEPESKGTLELQRFTLDPGAYVRVCEDVLTTGGTTRQTIAAVERQQGRVLPDLYAIANRGGSGQLDGRPIVSLIQPEFNVWEPAACPLCQQGSRAIRPKDNWAQLTHP